MLEQNRRAFLRNSLLAGTAVLTPFSLMKLLAGEKGKIISPNDKIHVGIIGTGSRGHHLAYLIKEYGHEIGMEVTALCDVYQPHLDHTHAMIPEAKTYKDHRKMLEDARELDGVIICTPLFVHAEPTIDALETGLHVLCEKAMERTLEATYAMAEAHYRTGKALHIGHQRLFDPKFLRGMNKVYEGDLGKVTQIRAFWHRNNDWRRPVPEDQPELERFINWRLYRDYSCGLLTELASHHIQVANWVKKDIPVDVRGTGSISFWKDGREVEDNVALIFTYKDGTQFIYDSMIQNRRHGLEVQVLGHKGTLELETNNFFLEDPPPQKPAGIIQLLHDLEENVLGKVPIGSSSWDPEVAMTYKGEPIVPENLTDGTWEQFTGFAKAIREDKPIPGLFEEGYYGSIWTLLGQQAIDSGKVIQIPKKYNISKFLM
ncbi:MAG: gfo/Idh/MocA family oxidoreductase [Bacteroidetes bacterium]|nr:MAG: gfo/Idh/MocA family oxidoreductase [Bacteroidota bacterium]